MKYKYLTLLLFLSCSCTPQKNQKKRPLSNQILYHNGGTGIRVTSEKKKRLENCNFDEKQIIEIERTLFHRWRTYWKNKNTSGFLTLLTKKAHIFDFPTILAIKDNKKNNPIIETLWKQNPSKAFSGSYLKQFKKISSFQLTPVSYLSIKKDRTKTMEMKRILLKTYFLLKGTNLSNQKRQDMGFLNIRLTRTEKNWKISQIDNLKMITIQKIKPMFKKFNFSSKLFQPLFQDFINIDKFHNFSSLSISKMSKDKLPNILLSIDSKAYILKISSLKLFKLKLNNQMPIVQSVLRDFNKDGFDDIFFYLFYSNSEMNEYFWSEINIYKNIGGVQFKKVPSFTYKYPSFFTSKLFFKDLNNDKLLDFLLPFTQTKNNQIYNNYLKHYSFLNNGNFLFKSNQDPKLDILNFSKYTNPQKEIIKDISFNMIDNDAKLDYVTLNSDNYLKVTTQKKENNLNFFKLSSLAKKIYISNKRNNELYIAVSHNGTNNIKRINQSCYQNWGEIYFKNWETSLTFLKLQNSSPVRLTQIYNQLLLTNNYISDLKFIDYNNDGYEDIYLATGFYTGNLKNNSKDYSFEYLKTFYNLLFMSTKTVKAPNNIKFFSSLISSSDFKYNIWAKQRNILFKNNKDGTFTDVAFLEGVDSLEDGNKIEFADLNNDGKKDLILLNSFHTKNSYHPEILQIFYNQQSKRLR